MNTGHGERPVWQRRGAKVDQRLRALIKGDNAARFMTKFRKDESGCWLWTRHISISAA